MPSLPAGIHANTHAGAAGTQPAGASHISQPGNGTPAEGTACTSHVQLQLLAQDTENAPQLAMDLSSHGAVGSPQVDLDLPAQLAEPESQDSGQPVAPDVVRGRMVRSASCFSTKRFDDIGLPHVMIEDTEVCSFVIAGKPKKEMAVAGIFGVSKRLLGEAARSE